MAIFENITKLVGNTPIIKLKTKNIYAKIECFNPTFSIKDRIAIYILNDALKKGFINKKTVIIEPTSGNTGIALASWAACYGHKLIIIMPENMSNERKKILTHLGAELVLTPKEKKMEGAVDKAQILLKKHKNSFSLSQFSNKLNPLCHAKTTAKEIIKDMKKIDYFVAGVGTGGSITGIGTILKKKFPKIKIIAVEPKKSAVLSKKKPGYHNIQGIGAGFIPKNLDMSIIDDIITVDDFKAINAAKELAKKEGILAGISSGANYFAAKKLTLKKAIILTIFPDLAERYISTPLFKDE